MTKARSGAAGDPALPYCRGPGTGPVFLTNQQHGPEPGSLQEEDR